MQGGKSLMELQRLRLPALGMLLAIAALSAVHGQDRKAPSGAAALIGRWDIAIQTPDGTYPSWLQVQLSGRRTLVGSFVGRVGSARPISRVDFQDGRIHFSLPPQWEERKDDQVFEGRLDDVGLRGETTDDQGRHVTWTAQRAPSLKRSQPPNWG